MVSSHNSLIAMMFFLIFVDCVALFKDLSQAFFSVGVESPNIKRWSLALTQNPLGHIFLERWFHFDIFQTSLKIVASTSLTSLCLMVKKPIFLRDNTCRTLNFLPHRHVIGKPEICWSYLNRSLSRNFCLLHT